MARIKSVARTAKGSNVTTTGAAARNIKVTKGAAATKVKSLFFFQFTPDSGKLLRAYLIAMIVAQLGSVKAGVQFKLWPGANLATHIAAGRMKRGSVTGSYVLSQAGANYLNDDAQKPAKEHLEAMLKAVTTGKRPADHDKEMSAMQLS